MLLACIAVLRSREDTTAMLYRLPLLKKCNRVVEILLANSIYITTQSGLRGTAPQATFSKGYSTIGETLLAYNVLLKVPSRCYRSDADPLQLRL
jgi:hypothetical protein